MVFLGLGIDVPPNSTIADLMGSGSGFFLSAMMSSAIVGSLKFGAFGIGRETDSVWRTTGFGIDAGADFFSSRENSSDEAAVFSRIGFTDPVFGVGGTAADSGAADETGGSGAGADADVLPAGRISSIIFGAAPVGVIGL